MTFNHKDLTAVLTEARAAFADARAAEEASRTSTAALRRAAVAMHEETHAAAVANVRRQLVVLGDALAELWAAEIVRRNLTGEVVPFEPSGSGEWLAKAILRAVPYSLGGRRLRGRAAGLAKRIAESTVNGLRPAERQKSSPPPADPYADDYEAREAEILATFMREAERPFWLPSPELTVRLGIRGEVEGHGRVSIPLLCRDNKSCAPDAASRIEGRIYNSLKPRKGARK